MIFDKKVKNLDMYDLGLTKLGVASMTLFLITVWPAAMTWVHSVHWGWFLGVALIAVARPIMRFIR